MTTPNKARLAAHLIAEVYEELDNAYTIIATLRDVTLLQQTKLQLLKKEIKRARASAQWYKWKAEQLEKKNEPSISEGTEGERAL